MVRACVAVLLALLFEVSFGVQAAVSESDVLGEWLAEEPGAGTTTIVELYRDGETIAGRVVRVLGRDGTPLTPVCAGCGGDLRGRPLAGLRFLWGLRRVGQGWGDGTVMDLREGLTQGLTATAEIKPGAAPGTLELRAYRGLRAFGQMRTWHRATNPAAGTASP